MTDPLVTDVTGATEVGTVCGTCGAATLPGDLFCEVCGASLGAPSSAPVAPTASATSAGSTSSAPTAPAGPTSGCARCGAPPTAVDADGYCTECGLLQPGPREHLEIDLGWAAGVTDRGLHHPRNEDAFHLELAGGPGGRGVVAVVCDGVSSSVRAEDASELAALAAAAVLASAVASTASLAEATVGGANAANKSVSALSWTPRGDLASPSCTLVSAACRSGEVAVGWVGDSRAYWVETGTGTVAQLTTDDSWAETQVEAGRMTEAEAEADPRSHAITRWIGADAPDVDAHVTTLAAAVPGRLLLCSDGLWNYASTIEAMAGLLAGNAAAATPLALAQSLTEFARQAGGHDNITVVVIDFPDETIANETIANEKGAT